MLKDLKVCVRAALHVAAVYRVVIHKVVVLYSVSPSPGSDVSTQAQIVSTCTHSLFLCAREPVCAVSLSAPELELRFANKRTLSDVTVRRKRIRVL